MNCKYVIRLPTFDKNAKIRKAQNMQIPYMIIIGDHEIIIQFLSGSRTDGMPFEEFRMMVMKKNQITLEGVIEKSGKNKV